VAQGRVGAAGGIGKDAVQLAGVMAELGEGRGEGGAAFGMPAAAGDVDFTVGGFDVHEINGVRGDDCDVYLEPLAIIVAQFEVVDDAIIRWQVVTEIGDGLLLGFVRWLADGDDLGQSFNWRSASTRLRGGCGLQFRTWSLAHASQTPQQPGHQPLPSLFGEL